MPWSLTPPDQAGLSGDSDEVDLAVGDVVDARDHLDRAGGDRGFDDGFRLGDLVGLRPGGEGDAVVERPLVWRERSDRRDDVVYDRTDRAPLAGREDGAVCDRDRGLDRAAVAVAEDEDQFHAEHLDRVLGAT